jgi:hypothetical protein
MKKLLFLMVVGFGGTMLLKNGYVTMSPDNQIRVAGWAVPIPASVQASPVMGMVSTLLQGNLGPAATTTAQARPGAQVPPPMPTVTSTLSTYNGNAPNGNAPRAGQTQGADQYNAVAKALR